VNHHGTYGHFALGSGQFCLRQGELHEVFVIHA
jgi:hypothetical protein